MKRTTGKTPTHELTKNERGVLQRAWAIVDELAFIHRGTPNGAALETAADELKQLVAEEEETG